MAVHNFATGDEKTVKVWSRGLEREVLPATTMSKFMGPTQDFGLQERDELTKSPGDRIRITLAKLLGGSGVSGNEPLESNEERNSFYTQDINIDQLRQAVRWYGRIDAQRVAFDIRNNAKVGLRDWWADILDRGWINQMAGNTVETDTNLTGLNSVTAYDSDHILYGGTATDVAGLDTSNDLFTLSLLDKAVERIRMFKERGTGEVIRPLKGGFYGCVLSPAQIYDMRSSTDTGQWLDIQKAVLQGGHVKDNPIFTGAHSMYNGVVIYEDSRIPKAINSGAYKDNTRAGFLFGAQGGFIGFGREGGRPDRFLWDEETFDYKNEHGCSASMIFGIERAVFNSKSFASLQLNTATTQN